jgi:hypothetical protein
MSREHKQLGTGWGGTRSGAGRKPQAKRGKNKPSLVPFPAYSEPDPSLKEPPDGLPEAQRRFWLKWAPLALERRTLSRETVPGFEMLCELAARCHSMALEFEMSEVPLKPADVRLYLQATKQVEGLFGRFCLAPFGKPVVSEKPKQAVNPFAQVIGQ